MTEVTRCPVTTDGRDGPATMLRRGSAPGSIPGGSTAAMLPQGESMRAIIYRRVSTGAQGKSGLGLEAQEAACRLWAERADCEVASVQTDVLGGSTAPTDRPGLTDALALLVKGDVLLVAKRDRLSRDPYYMMIVERMLSKLGCRLVSAAGEASADDSPTGVLMRRILDAFAEFERLMIGVRTRAAKKAARARGSYCGGRVPAARVLAPDGTLGDTGAIVAARTAVAGGRSLREAARVMARHGFVAPSGKPYAPSVVAAMLRDGEAK